MALVAWHPARVKLLQCVWRGKSSLAKPSLLSACPVLSTHGLSGCCMEQCLVTLPVREGGQRCCHLHTLPHGRPSRILAFPPASVSNLKEGWLSVDAGTLLPPSGTARALHRKQQTTQPASLRSTVLEKFDVRVQKDFRATLPGICSPLA